MLLEVKFADYVKLSDRTRFNLKKTSSLLIEPIFNLVKKLIEKNGDRIDKTLKIVGFYDGEVYEIHYKNKKSRGKINASSNILNDDEFITTINDIGELTVDIHVETGETFLLDADYAYDARDRDDVGGLVIIITLPEGEVKSDFIDKISKEIIAEIVHELQHVSQRLIHGIKFDRRADKSFIRHMNDIDEIDARIEEILAILPDDFDVHDQETFKNELSKYADQYLSENGITCDSKDCQKHKQNMIDNHMEKYREKFNL